MIRRITTSLDAYKEKLNPLIADYLKKNGIPHEVPEWYKYQIDTNSPYESLYLFEEDGEVIGFAVCDKHTCANVDGFVKHFYTKKDPLKYFKAIEQDMIRRWNVTKIKLINYEGAESTIDEKMAQELGFKKWRSVSDKEV